MKKLFLFLSLAMFVLSHNINAQKKGAIESIGAGIIDFLLTNPKTANKYNPTEKNALSTIGNVLNTLGERKHQVNVSASGKPETVINNNIPGSNPSFSGSPASEMRLVVRSPEGDYAEIFLDEKENMYILYRNVIYPISSSLVEQAKEENSMSSESFLLLPYNLHQIKRDFSFERSFSFEGMKILRKEPRFLVYYVEKGYEFSLFDFSKMINLPESKIEIIGLRGITSKKRIQQIRTGKAELTHGAMLKINLLELPSYSEIHEKRESKIKFLFTCKWEEDFQGDGSTYDDFQDIRNHFSKEENFLFVIGYQTNYEECSVLINVYNFKTGENLYETRESISSGDLVLIKPFENCLDKEGVYLINTRLDYQGKVVSAKTEKFEITSF